MRTTTQKTFYLFSMLPLQPSPIAMQDSLATTPQTPVREVRVPNPNRSDPSGIRIITASVVPTTPAATTQTAEQREAQLRQQLLQMQTQLNNLTNSVATTTQGVPVPPAPIHHLSREYWAKAIDKSILYPGEDASNNAKTAYLQRLDSYIVKSPHIWALVSGTTKCPIATDNAVIAALKGTFDSEHFGSLNQKT